MGNLFREIDPVLGSWVDKHTLALHSSMEGREIRTVYVSSVSGETFQIWIDPPAEGKVCIHAACIEGRREDAPVEQRLTSLADLEENLDGIYRLVMEWMTPSERFFSKPEQI